jgi:hypothetical protein
VTLNPKTGDRKSFFGKPKTVFGNRNRFWFLAKKLSVTLNPKAGNHKQFMESENHFWKPKSVLVLGQEALGDPSPQNWKSKPFWKTKTVFGNLRWP